MFHRAAAQSYARIDGKATATRLAALVCCVCVTAALTLSIALALSHAAYGPGNEDCGDGCAVCGSVAAARKLLKQICAFAAAVILLLKNKYLFAFILAQALLQSSLHTLINLKIRLNN
jgi:hypothetical protein